MLQDTAKSRLKRDVKVTACVMFAVNLCCGITAMLLFRHEVAADSPNMTYSIFAAKCAAGEVERTLCRTAAVVVDKLCNLTDVVREDCVACIDHNLRFAALTIIALLLCCVCFVPACGYYGAEHASPNSLRCFMIFNMLATMSYAAVTLVCWLAGRTSCAAVAFFVGILLPAVGFVCTCRLQRQTKPLVLALPLLPGDPAGQLVQVTGGAAAAQRLQPRPHAAAAPPLRRPINPSSAASRSGLSVQPPLRGLSDVAVSLFRGGTASGGRPPPTHLR